MGTARIELIDKLTVTNKLSDKDMAELLKYRNSETTEYIFNQALRIKENFYDKKIFIRGTIELSNYCKNDCYYCGLQRSNKFITRFRLDENDIIQYCVNGYEKGIRTFVLTGGDDYYFTENRVASIISMIKTNFPDCAVQLCLGERPVSSYKKWFAAGATRYLLWHETANDNHFKKFILLICRSLKENRHCGSLKKLDIKLAAVLWLEHLIRQLLML